MPVVVSELKDMIVKWLFLASSGEISCRTENEIFYLF